MFLFNNCLEFELFNLSIEFVPFNFLLELVKDDGDFILDFNTLLVLLPLNSLYNLFLSLDLILLFSFLMFLILSKLLLS